MSSFYGGGELIWIWSEMSFPVRAAQRLARLSRADGLTQGEGSGSHARGMASHGPSSRKSRVLTRHLRGGADWGADRRGV
jgi:hypothetical protein